MIMAAYSETVTDIPSYQIMNRCHRESDRRSSEVIPAVLNRYAVVGWGFSERAGWLTVLKYWKHPELIYRESQVQGPLGSQYPKSFSGFVGHKRGIHINRRKGIR